MVKAANINLIRGKKIGGGYFTVIMEVGVGASSKGSY